MIHIWVGSDAFQQEKGAERVLEYSIRKHASQPVTMHWMRAGSPGFEVSANGESGSWNLKRAPNQAWPKVGDGTDFSRFRLAIPELSGFSGVHVYLDADMLVLGDVAELVALPRKKPWLCLSASRTDVSVIDCAAFRGLGWWPPLSRLKPERSYLHDYRNLLAQRGFFDASLPHEWNYCDDRRRPIEVGDFKAKLLHFTVVPTQPWHPYPNINYGKNWNPEWCDLWKQYERESLAART